VNDLKAAVPTVLAAEMRGDNQTIVPTAIAQVVELAGVGRDDFRPSVLDLVSMPIVGEITSPGPAAKEYCGGGE